MGQETRADHDFRPPRLTPAYATEAVRHWLTGSIRFSALAWPCAINRRASATRMHSNLSTATQLMRISLVRPNSNREPCDVRNS